MMCGVSGRSFKTLHFLEVNDIYAFLQREGIETYSTFIFIDSPYDTTFSTYVGDHKVYGDSFTVIFKGIQIPNTSTHHN